ncbi:uncharacterized protein (TIGR02646 family) [Pseudomonas fluorescens]|uniref:AAA family ATPase n=1 Tax=Pseudomonas fluorescens TaxID=294 RepID=UPI0020A16B81|nr:AAA family ATPase [Pseudomonas fluorescens]MCP1488378.1 uncharacterized protein (TIGR02646 family) [Pseudomonas fluorescens]
MIIVDRHNVPPPPDLLDYHRREIERLRPFFEAADVKYSQKIIDFRMPRALLEQVRDALLKLFKGKCAFCERAATEIEHFRPYRRAGRVDGSIDPHHYWWLANDWENLYLCCPRCNVSKRNLFPVLGAVASPLGDRQSLLDEQPLLLDPCRDNPQEHLRFLSDGQVIALTERGAATIKVFQLNEGGLVFDRLRRASEIMERCEELLSLEYLPGLDEKAIRRIFTSTMPLYAITPAVLDAFFSSVSAVPVAPPEPPVLPPEAMKAIPDAIWIEAIEIHNFKVISDLRIKFPPLQSNGEHAIQPWLMVLGENGVGKSSLLQAIAMTMRPAKELDALDASTWLRKGRGIIDGFVRLAFSDGSQRELTFKKNGKKFGIAGELPGLPVLAYGSTRLLPGNDAPTPVAPPRVSVLNLFNPIHPLVQVERYLCNKRKISEAQFTLLATSLKDLLPVNSDATLIRKNKNMICETDGGAVTLSELSDGYKSVLALAMDIMFHLTSSSFDMESAQGVVMIDELEVHLHPRWKIQIVDRLRQLFPRVRFIVSTHDPLCVQGLKDGELWVMAKHPEDKRFIFEQIDVPPGTRADEILTGPWFGLQSTIDTHTLMLMSEHSVLLQKNEPDSKRLAELEATLRQRMVSFGSTRAQRAALAAAAVLDAGMSESQANQLIRHRLQNIQKGDSDQLRGRDDA